MGYHFIYRGCNPSYPYIRLPFEGLQLHLQLIPPKKCHIKSHFFPKTLHPNSPLQFVKPSTNHLPMKIIIDTSNKNHLPLTWMSQEVSKRLVSGLFHPNESPIYK